MRNRHLYHTHWEEISFFVTNIKAKCRCELCGVEQFSTHPKTKKRVVLAVAHIDQNRDNNELSNLKALCQVCHRNFDNDYVQCYRKRSYKPSGKPRKTYTRKEPQT